MAYRTILVPERHAGGLRRALLAAHARCLDALARDLARYRAAHDRLDALEGGLVELRDLHEALEQIGWAPRRGAVALSAHPEVLDEAVRAVAGAAFPPRWLSEQL
jgi:hypothetical protein